MPHRLPFVSRMKLHLTPWPTACSQSIGPADIVIVGDDGVRICHVETAGDPHLDGPTPLSLCYDAGNRQPTTNQVTQTGGVLMLRVK